MFLDDSSSDHLRVEKSQGLTLVVKSGRANINGAFYWQKDDETITLEKNIATKSYNIMLRLNDNDAYRNITLVASDINDGITRNDSIYDLVLATVTVTGNASEVKGSDITDTRLDSTRCGAVTSAIKSVQSLDLFNQVTELFKEIKAQNESEMNENRTEFNDWFETVKDTLDSDTAGKLSNRISDVENMIMDNHFTTILLTEDGTLVDENGHEILSDWSYEVESGDITEKYINLDSQIAHNILDAKNSAKNAQISELNAKKALNDTKEFANQAKAELNQIKTDTSVLKDEANTSAVNAKASENKTKEYADNLQASTNDISELKEDLTMMDESLKGNIVNYSLIGKLERGGIVSGNNYEGGYEYERNHWRSKGFILDGYKNITIQSDDNNLEFNFWMYSSTLDVWKSSGWGTEFDCSRYDKYRIAFGTIDGTELSEQYISSHISIVATKSYTDKTLSVENMSADAKKTGTEIENIKYFINYKNDISNDFTIYYGENVYLDNGNLVFEDSNSLRCRTDLIKSQNIDILITPKDGIKVNCYVNEDGVWSNSLAWSTEAFYLPKNCEVYLTFGKTDNSEFVVDEPLADFLKTYLSKSKYTPMFRLIHSISQELVVSDNNNESGSMQGMCFDGENIWYYITGINSLRKYNINTTETTEYTNLGLGHGNDITYNPNTRKLYVAVAEGTGPIVKTIDIDTMTVGEFELNEIDGLIASIAYNKEVDEYVVIGGQAYNRDGNIDGWTRKQMVIYDKNFDPLKSFILPNDYSATQGVEFDGRYIYFCKSFYNGSHNDKVYVYDINGNIVNSFSSGTGEVEAISKIDDYNFYIAKNENSYKGGYVYKATVTEESYENVVNLLYKEYMN